ncbi:uncharacterized protein LOC109612777 [Musca domestica]|uniref:Uncharacterized protein LOC109612777 n=1 Tax=Musca domestica TaxID=7370 RepID=A0ABM3VGD7_MUSDO|nr:uncharacterized protein LOC109612777 [Musca domestica]
MRYNKASIYKQKDVITTVKNTHRCGGDPPVITVYGAIHKEMVKLLNELIGHNTFFVQKKPKNLATVLLLNLKHLFKARNALLESGIDVVMHTLEDACDYRRTMTAEGYKPAISLYGARIKKVVKVLTRALGPKKFFVSVNEEYVVAIHLSFMPSFSVVCNELIERNYNINTSDTFLIDERIFKAEESLRTSKCFSCQELGHFSANCKFLNAQILARENEKNMAEAEDYEEESGDLVEYVEPEDLIENEESEEMAEDEESENVTEYEESKDVAEEEEPENVAVEEVSENLEEEEESEKLAEKEEESEIVTEEFKNTKENNEIPPEETENEAEISYTSTTSASSLETIVAPPKVSRSATMLEACTRRYGENFLETFALLRQFAPEFHRISQEKGEDAAMRALQYKLLSVEI